MAETNTPRFGLRQWGAGTDGPSRTEFNTAFANVESLAAIYGQGTLAARPAASKAGRFYWVTGDGTTSNNGILWYDNGSLWTQVGSTPGSLSVTGISAGSVPVTVTGATGQTAVLTQWKSSAGTTLASVSAAGLGAFTGLTVTGNETVSGTLGVTGVTTLGSLIVTGTSSLNSLAVSGVATVASLAVSGTSVLHSTAVTTLDASGAVTCATTLAVTGTSTLGIVNASGKITGTAGMGITGASTVAALTASGLITANAGITTTTIAVSGRISLTGAADVASSATRLDGNPKTQFKADGTARADGLLPPGLIMMCPVATPPAGWLNLDGTVYLKSTYPDLAAFLGATYETDGTHFQVPDSRGRFPLGAGGTLAAALGALGGATNYTIGTSNLPAHSHAIDHNHASATTSTSGVHDHDAAHSNASGPTGFTFNEGNGSGVLDSELVRTNGDHTHTLDLPNFVGTSGSTGSGAALAITPPFFAVNWVIKS